MVLSFHVFMCTVKMFGSIFHTFSLKVNITVVLGSIEDKTTIS